MGAEAIVACNLERFVELNQGQALWWMVAGVLETRDLAVAEKVLTGIGAEQ
jgi:hypothetical protein